MTGSETGLKEKPDALEAMLRRAADAEEFIEGLKEQVVGLEECLAATARQRDRSVEKLCDKITENVRLDEIAQTKCGEMMILQASLDRATDYINELRAEIKG